MSDTSSTLLQYGALGAIAIVFLGLVSFAFRVILVRFLRAFDKIAETLNMLVKELAIHASSDTDQHRMVMTTLHNNQGVVVDKFEGLKRESRERRNTGKG